MVILLGAGATLMPFVSVDMLPIFMKAGPRIRTSLEVRRFGERGWVGTEFRVYISRILKLKFS